MSDANKPLCPKDEKRLLTRGKGCGKEYQPFVLVGEVPGNQGESIRVRSTTVGRVHDLLSGIEFAAFMVFDWCEATLDIREQYPLPLSDTLDIAKQLGIKHPQVSGELRIVTTDLLVDFPAGQQLAVAVKPWKQLNDRRTLDKLQIEKLYWEERGVEWKLFTDREVTPAIRENLDWLRVYMDVDAARDFSLDESDVDSLLLRIRASAGGKVTLVCGRLDDEYGMDPGYHVGALRYAIAHRYLRGPLTKSYRQWVVDDLQEVRPKGDSVGVNHAS